MVSLLHVGMFSAAHPLATPHSYFVDKAQPPPYLG
jgi:hypothetical protein